ncbi:MAG: hypothetical protein U0R80_05420 [Nocardioidaceae bacterium]
MAGGYGRGAGVPLEERVRATRRGQEPGDPLPAARPALGVRHCWVTEPGGPLEPVRPGLLLAWRRLGGRWEGRVVYAVELRPGTWATVDAWVAAELLSPGDGDSGGPR